MTLLKRTVDVVGCGGNRDKTNDQLWRIASELSDKVVLTDNKK
jgi:UDP-N-acetylmuramyl tripeptide synthase